jgi:hypothetical protein
MASCCTYLTLAVIEEVGLWLWGRGFGIFGALGLNNTKQGLTPTRVDAQHLDSAKITAAAAGD